MDGAATDNLPRCHLNNTITISPYAGESDLCPLGSGLSFHAVRFKNVSIQVNAQNMYRVTSTFFPPGPEVRAEPGWVCVCVSQHGPLRRLGTCQNWVEQVGLWLNQLEPARTSWIVGYS